jgi:hypothetical protein
MLHVAQNWGWNGHGPGERLGVPAGRGEDAQGFPPSTDQGGSPFRSSTEG